jgi:hypothetical protein
VPDFPSDVRPLVQGIPWGETFPPKPNPPVPSLDGRTAALYVLRDYITALTFRRYAGPSAPPIAFKISPANFHVEWPDSNQDEVTPSISVTDDRADYDVIGLVSYIEEDTINLYAPGTVLQWQAEYVETINLEIHTSKKAERRAICAGMEIAFSPTEQMSGVRFQMPLYFDELVCFTLMRRENMDTEDSARNRRVAQIELQMRFNIVQLVNVADMQPSVVVNTDVDQVSNQPIDLTQDPRAVLGSDLRALRSYLNATSASRPTRLFTPQVSSYTGGPTKGLTFGPERE